MRSIRNVLLYVASMFVLLSIPASAQVPPVPPHQPGTVCFTPTFWCWAPRFGPPGGQCACPAPQGYWVPGFLG